MRAQTNSTGEICRRAGATAGLPSSAGAGGALRTLWDLVVTGALTLLGKPAVAPMGSQQWHPWELEASERRGFLPPLRPAPATHSATFAPASPGR
jgi:hypothetical protein